MTRLSWAFIVDSVPFTPDVVSGQSSLGGSESACLGLARALAARGHDVKIFATKLDPALDGTIDHAEVSWWSYDDSFAATNRFIEFDVVVALRVFAAFGLRPVNARLRLLWNQDLLVPGEMASQVMAIAWALDHTCYVSAYHKAQWEQLQPELNQIGWVTRNSFDPTDLPVESTKDFNRIIHISRPERGLAPLLAMWPELRRQKPDATLQICRYSSMYDTGAGSWSEVCASYDDLITKLNAQVGGITYLGELNKKQLYQAISDAAVMWYPGVSQFAETSCIAAIEAQACGTPFVGSYRGALPETIPSGVLIPGDDTDPAYREASIAAVLDLLNGCQTHGFDYRQRVNAGYKHAARYTHHVVAQQWEAQVLQWFEARYAAEKPRVLRQLLHEDDHTAAKVVATELGDQDAIALCDRVIAGQEHTATQYGEGALADVAFEAERGPRFKAGLSAFEGRAHVLDVACGNGAFALALAKADPAVHVHGVDFSPVNIERARAAAEKAGYADRLTFTLATIYDFATHRLTPEMDAFLDKHAGQFDGLFCGEFIEHVAGYQAVIDGVERALQPGAAVLYTCPHGACVEIADLGQPYHRGHVHRFHYDDVASVWGPKRDLRVVYMSSGTTAFGQELGSWMISYQYAADRPAGPRADRIRRTRPRPSLSVGLITLNAANDLGRCLESVRRIADEMLVGDTGSTDRTKTIAAEYGARVFDVTPVAQQREGFAGARNAVLQQATGDWFLWIDADEMLVNSTALWRYLDSHVFHGFVLHQTHLYLDGAPTFDIPVRVFRNTGRVQFYGCVHEQPQQDDCNTDITPALDIGDIQIAHWGYLTAQVREDKRTTRNLPLLMRDQQVFPDRLLGKVLCVREAVLQADTYRVTAGRMTNAARDGYQFALAIHQRYFDDPANKYHKISRPWYEAALRHLQIGWEQEIALAGRQGGLGHSQAKPERLWVRDADEYERVLGHMVKAVATKMRPPAFLTDPDAVLPIPVEQHEAVAV